MRGFTTAWNAEQKERAVAQEGQRQELKRLARKIGDLVASSADSLGSAAILAALTEAEACQALLQAELAVAEPAEAVSREGGGAARGTGGGGRSGGPVSRCGR